MTASSDNGGIVKNIFAGYFILLLHVLLLVVLGLFIVFFRGLVLYLPWIVGGLTVLLLLSAWWFYRRYRRGARSLAGALAAVPTGRAVEISLLGGLASMRVGAPAAGAGGGSVPLQLEDPRSARLRQLDRLLEMYQQQLISREEFLALKAELLAALPEEQDSGQGTTIAIRCETTEP